jgi:hypothetical protein
MIVCRHGCSVSATFWDVVSTVPRYFAAATHSVARAEFPLARVRCQADSDVSAHDVWPSAKTESF